MDYLSRLYTTRMSFDGITSIPIRWVWCQPGAKDLGFPSPFTSRNWDQWEIWWPIGEVQYARRDYGRHNQGIVSSATGLSPPCGPHEIWRHGGSAPGIPVNMFGLAMCCGGLLAPAGQPTLGLIPQAVYVSGVWTPVMRVSWPRRRLRIGPAPGGVRWCPALAIGPAPPPVRPWTPRRQTIYPGVRVDPLRRLLVGPLDPLDRPLEIR